MRTRLGGLPALVALAATVVIAAAQPGAAPTVLPVDYDYVPDPTTSVSAAWATEVVVDERHGKVFVPQRDDGLLVLDLEGNPITTIAMPGAQRSLSLSPNADSIFLVASDALGDAAFRETDILRVDTISHRVEKVAESDFPDDCQFGPIEQLGGRLWFATNCPHTTGTGGFGYVDLADGAVVEVAAPDRDIDGIYSFPGRLDRLVLLVNRYVQLVRVRQTDPATVTLMAVRSYATSTGVAGVSPDGSEIVVAGENGGGRRYSAENLASIGGYRGDFEATAIAVRADGTVAIGSDWGIGLSIYRPGQFAPIRTYRLNTSPSFPAGVVRHGLAWGALRLYAVRGNGDFFAFVPRRRPHLQAVVESREYRYGEKVPIEVALAGPSTGRAVVLWTVGRQGDRQRVGMFQVPEGRPATIMAVARRYGHFEATFAGNDQYDPTYDKTADIRVSARVESAIHSGRLVNGVHVHRVSEPVDFRGRVLPDHAGDCLQVDIEVLSGGLWRAVTSPCVTLDETSTALAKFEGSRTIVGKRFRIRGFFRGDGDNTQATSRWRYFKFVR